MNKKFITLAIIILILTSAAFGQKIKSYKRPIDKLASVKKGVFSSTEAGFQIDLPKQLGGFSGDTGIEYQWRLDEGFYIAGIIDKNTNVENSAEFETATTKIIESVISDFAREYFETKSEIVKSERKTIEFKGHKGIEMRVALTDAVIIARVFWVKNRAFKLGVLLAGNMQKFETDARKVFDSLVIFDQNSTDEMIRRKIEENTPKPLPQTPVAKRATTDAEDKN